MKNTITSKSIWNEHTFEIVDRIPENFTVWNIGVINGYEEYLPLCESLHPEDKKCYDVNTATLKAVRLSKEEVKILLDAAHYSVNNLKAAEKFLKSKRRGPLSDRRRAYAEKTVEIFIKIA